MLFSGGKDSTNCLAWAPDRFARVDEAASARRARAHPSPAWLIGLYAVRSNAMPPGNVTEMTPEGRRTLAAWIEAGAPGKW